MDNLDDVYRLICEVRKARRRLAELIARMETERTTRRELLRRAQRMAQTQAAALGVATVSPAELIHEPHPLGRHDDSRSAHVCRGERYLDDEDATLAGHIADADLTSVRPDRLPSDRKPQAKAGSIAAAPVAEHLKIGRSCPAECRRTRLRLRPTHAASRHGP
jgi:hypothetical protein